MLEFAITIGIILFTWIVVKNLPDTNKPRETEREVHERIEKEKELRSKEHEQKTEEEDESNEEEGEMIYATQERIK
jgi:hypothetical protein